jgi:hypothetical protein
MHRYFSHYWSFDDNDLPKADSTETPLDHTVGSQFTQRGVEVGDFVYILSVKRGVLYLFGKLQVGEFLFSDEEAGKRLRYEPWSGPEHLIAEFCTPVQVIEVPDEVVERLRFETATGRVSLRFTDSGKLDRQTARGVRQLTYESALELDKLLPAMEPFSPSKPSAWREKALRVSARR